MTQVSAIVGGKTEVEAAHLGELSDFFSEEEVAQIPAKKAYAIKGYWLKCLKDVEAVGGFIFPDDEPLLEHLTNIVLTVDEKSDNYDLAFHFAPNDYIENSVLTLKVEVDKDDDCKKITSDEVQWKADKCLTEKTVKKTQTNKKTKKKREIEKKQKVESFFHFFKTRSMEDEDDEEEDLDDLEDGGMGVYHDAQSVGDSLSVIKYMVTKYHAASFFGATIPDYEFDDGFGDEGDDDEDDDDEEGAKPAKKEKKKGPDGKQAEECKKQ